MTFPGPIIHGGHLALFGLEFRASATSTAATITIPSGAKVNDFAILGQWSRSASGIPTKVTPTNWTNIAAMDATLNSTSDVRAQVDYRILQSGEPGSSITGMDGDTADIKVMLVFGKVIGSVTINDAATEMTDGNPASQTCNASGGTAPLVVIGIAAGTGTGEFTTASPAFDAEVAQGDMRMGYKVYESSPADHSIDMDDDGFFNWLGSLFVEVAA